jgi:hypothetical protein
MEAKMTKRFASFLALLLLSAVLTGAWMVPSPAPAATPNVTFTLVQGLPDVMNIGETATVVVHITSDQKFVFAQMLPSFYFPGRLVRATNMGGDRVGAGTAATLQLTFVAIGSTAGYPGGVAPVSVVPGVHYKGGYTVAERLTFNVAVP